MQKAESFMQAMIADAAAMGGAANGAVEPDVVTYSTLISAHAKAGNVPGAEAWLQALLERGLKPNHVTYSTVISACSRGGDVRGASKWLEKMLNDPEVKPNVVSFNSAIQAAAKAGDLAVADRHFRRLLADGLGPDSFTYAALLLACFRCRPRQPERAKHYFGDMIARRS